MYKKLFSMLIFLFVALYANAQSSQKVSELLETKVLNKGQASYLVATYMNLVQEEASYEDAFNALAEKNLFSSAENFEQPVTLSKVSLLCMNAVGLKGGLFYTIFHNGRYAFRELKARTILPNTVDPDMKIDGADLIALINGCEDAKAGRK
ncbi:MAG: hypothetical protein IJL70_08020 [Treponema sp.]|nr:hypothetical protein [Treponema sp.]